MSDVVADTHTIIWYFDAPQNLSAPAHNALHTAEISGGVIYISAITLVEITYLVEKGKIAVTALNSLHTALRKPQAILRVFPLDLAVAQALQQISRTAVPDMPDRIIAATAAYLQLPLITRDAKIQAASITTIW